MAVDHVLSGFFEPIRHFDPVRAQQLKVEAMQEVRNILARVDNAYPALIISSTTLS